MTEQAQEKSKDPVWDFMDVVDEAARIKRFIYGLDIAAMGLEYEHGKPGAGLRALTMQLRDDMEFLSDEIARHHAAGRAS